MSELHFCNFELRFMQFMWIGEKMAHVDSIIPISEYPIAYAAVQ